MRSGKPPNCSLAVEFALINENILIQNEKITQVYVIQSEQTPLEWFGVLFVDSGLYKGATIRFKILIDETYPNCSCPKIFLDPIPTHPLVEPNTGELDTKHAFPDWTSTTHKLYRLLLFMKRVIRDATLYIEQITNLIKDLRHGNNHSSEEGALETTYPDIEYQQQEDNKQDNLDLLYNFLTWPQHTLRFLDIYENNPDEFKLDMENFKTRCCHHLYGHTDFMGDDKNALVFDEWKPDLHEPIRECVLAGKFTPPSLFAAYHKETDSVSFIPGDGD